MKLTDEEIRDCMDAADQSYCERDGNKELFIARAIESAVLERLTKVDVEPNPDHVICPGCCHQFRAIPVNVQDELAALRAENEALKIGHESSRTSMLEMLAKHKAHAAEIDELKKEASFLSHLAAQHLSEARAAQELNKKLQALVDGNIKLNEKLQAENASLFAANRRQANLIAQLEQAQADAARYRFIREGNFTGQWLLSEVSGGWAEGMDKTIDAARAALEKPDAKT